jgi:hypothetical protein
LHDGSDAVGSGATTGGEGGVAFALSGAGVVVSATVSSAGAGAICAIVTGLPA